MSNCKRTVLLAFALLLNHLVIAQNATNSAAGEEVEFMRSEGKIYVVMAIVITILAGLIFYIVRLDRKIQKLENNSGI